MTNEKLTETILDISSKISALDSTLQNINHNTEKLIEQILQHEQRITTLEQFHKPIKNDSSLKDDLLKLLCKAILIGSVSIAFLAGAGGVISKLFGA